MAATYPEQVYQNHMVNHPLLQYQMLFPSLLISLSAPPNEEPMVDNEGNVDTVDYLKFSALANQLAITQINQVLMDLVMETPGDDLKKMMELQKGFMELVQKGFSQLNKELTNSKTLIDSNTQVVSKQDGDLTKIQDMVAKGFLDSLSMSVDLKETAKHISELTASENQEFRGMLNSVGDSLLKIHYVVSNITDKSLCCNNTGTHLTEDFLKKLIPPTPPPILSSPILQDIKGELRNLTKTLTDFLITSEKAAAERAVLRDLMEKCANCSQALQEKDTVSNNLTRVIEEGFVNNMDILQPQILNITEKIDLFDSSVKRTQEDVALVGETLAKNFTKIDEEFQNFKKLALDRFSEISSKIDELFNNTLQQEIPEVSKCPDFGIDSNDFFEVGDKCFFLNTESLVDFEEAQAECEKNENTYLAEPVSLAKFLALIEDIPFNKTSGLWLGGEKKENVRLDNNLEDTGIKNYVWEWINAKQIITHGWNIGYPLEEDCVYVDDIGLKTSQCDTFRGFVCERSV